MSDTSEDAATPTGPPGATEAQRGEAQPAGAVAEAEAVGRPADEG